MEPVEFSFYKQNVYHLLLKSHFQIHKRHTLLLFLLRFFQIYSDCKKYNIPAPIIKHNDILYIYIYPFIIHNNIHINKYNMYIVYEYTSSFFNFCKCKMNITISSRLYYIFMYYIGYTATVARRFLNGKLFFIILRGILYEIQTRASVIIIYG